MPTTLVIPCYNEQARLQPDAMKEFAAQWAGRMLLVDDGSTDGTLAMLQALQSAMPASFEVMSLRLNRGKAEAVRLGLLRAIESGADLVGYWDADLATPLRVVPSFESAMAQHPQVAVMYGSRVKLMGSQIERRLFRHYIGRIFATAASVILKLPIYDTQCGAKLFRVDAGIKKIFDQPFLTRWAFDVEILARFLGRRDGEEALGPAEAIYELAVPVWRDVPGSKIRPMDMFKAPVDMARIALHYR